MQYRGAITSGLAGQALARLHHAPIQVKRPRQLMAEAWTTANRLGWAKTYDAEYVALARLLKCALLTMDSRLARGAAGQVRIRTPADL
jgi:predicted nucleic acid-binding protein